MTGKTLVLTRSEATKEPRQLRLSLLPASTLLGLMSTMALQTLSGSASRAKLPAVLALLALLTPDNLNKGIVLFKFRFRLETRRIHGYTENIRI